MQGSRIGKCVVGQADTVGRPSQMRVGGRLIAQLLSGFWPCRFGSTKGLEEIRKYSVRCQVSLLCTAQRRLCPGSGARNNYVLAYPDQKMSTCVELTSVLTCSISGHSEIYSPVSKRYACSMACRDVHREPPVSCNYIVRSLSLK